MAALKAFLLNRVGDWALTLGIQLTIGLISDLSMASLFSVASYLNGDLVFVLTIQLLIGASAKSAQVGQHGWQASAMEGPTPVSAQIHAATILYISMRYYTSRPAHLLSKKIQDRHIKPNNTCTDLIPQGYYVQGWHYL